MSESVKTKRQIFDEKYRDNGTYQYLKDHNPDPVTGEPYGSEEILYAMLVATEIQGRGIYNLPEDFDYFQLHTDLDWLRG